MMYEDLIKRLHRQAAYLPEKFSKNAELLDVLMKASDAIEELQKAVNFHKFNSEFWEDKYNSLADEKWIPVTEEHDGEV